ncbi:TMEM175 family protein [Paractinoplanes maris]|uniref:TMEM175 family protein n=1 Tax=Paractinoplanes maris TaxID=1734446 RepID=UPI0020204171|nr:TMEM175 family protein [Actinoplanes maris]
MAAAEEPVLSRRAYGGSKGRLEAFSDGVLAVVITLLALDLHVQADGPGSLAPQLRHEWPSFAAFALSFFVVGVIWVNHHALFALVARVDRTVVFLNLLLLMWVTTIPFSTSALADYLRTGGLDTHLAVLLYGISNEGMALSFTLILRHLLRRQLLRWSPGAGEARGSLRRFGLGTALYPVITLVGFFAPVVMLLLYAAQTGFYMVEQTPILPPSTSD